MCKVQSSLFLSWLGNGWDRPGKEQLLRSFQSEKKHPLNGDLKNGCQPSKEQGVECSW